MSHKGAVQSPLSATENRIKLFEKMPKKLREMRRQAGIRRGFSSCLLCPLSQLKTIRQIRSSRQVGLVQVNMVLIIVVMGFGTGSSGGQKRKNLRRQWQQEPGFSKCW